MERKLIDWLAGKYGSTRHARLGIGDDCAVLPADCGELVVTCDVVCDGVHFQSDRHTPEQIGHKALAVNLSDLAAMGATPGWATVALVIPETAELDHVKRLYAGMEPLAEQFDIEICGGDTTVWRGNLVISITAIGVAPVAGVWRVDGAKPGDRILVTGLLGGSILGRHLTFLPRCDFAARWRDSDLINACTDISDSLSLDLAKIARASGVGFEIEASNIPVSAAARELAGRDAKSGNGAVSATDRALCDGEDFELIVIASPEAAARLQRETSADIGLSDIGQITGQCNEYFLLDEGRRRHLVPTGFEHKFGRNPAPGKK